MNHRRYFMYPSTFQEVGARPGEFVEGAIYRETRLAIGLGGRLGQFSIQGSYMCPNHGHTIGHRMRKKHILCLVMLCNSNGWDLELTRMCPQTTRGNSRHDSDRAGNGWSSA